MADDHSTFSEISPSGSEAEPVPFDVSARQQYVDELKKTADKLARDHASIGDLKIITRAIKELRYAFKIFTPYRRRRKVTVFGSARTPPDDPDFQASIEFGREIAAEGWMVVTGAGNGIMEGAHLGAGQEMSMGVNIMLPFEQEANSVIAKDEKLVHFRYFFTRKLLFVKEVHAVALFPGGYGTLDELFEILTLVQTGKRDPLPIVCVDTPESTYWDDWEIFIRRQLLDRKLISPNDLALFRIAHSVPDAVREIVGFYSVYHSSRYIRDQLVIRLERDPTDELLERLNHDFADILESGRIERAPTHPHEYDDEHIRHLPRIALRFNRRDHGRLRLMIDAINRGLTDKGEG
jgi:uncharacterized protein (TIGR00730 family)